MSPHARAKQKIATLMEEVELLKQDKATKQCRKTTYYVSQGQAIHHMVVLYTPIEDLVAENDRQCEESDMDCTKDYIELAKTLPWFHDKLASFDHEESEDMLKKLKQGVDSAHGDDTGTLKELVASWVNIECHPTPLIRTNDKHHRGFTSDACGKLLCPAEWCWDDLVVRAGIHDHTTAFIVSENSWPSFMYENYEADTKNLEHGLMKLKLLVRHHRGSRLSSLLPPLPMKLMVKMMTLISLRTTDMPRDDQIKIQFALSSITSWRTVDGDFNYQIFWNNIIDLFEDAPGPAVRARMTNLLEWWTRKVFGRNHQEDLTSDIVSQMSVSALAAQRQLIEDAAFDPE
ncbi:uncharacterized protein BJ212DRAFT_1294674 [Suillus subaureus]|uniref:Uncharacterized protein n=1 Tax=Suillus subaureus TaxID=48587 RepID=A0A9P7JKM9_9AGAM|nr:uncharacterized protein BJ212DRAFT_1294674 [Suillus subaureus]KAG1827384.1 hypothetical protein BJ212DRAFT_1294674 [Suillus subaureus]